MKTQAIIDKILSDAENRAKEIIENAERQAADTIRAAELLAEETYEKAKAEFGAVRAGVIDSRKMSADIQAKNIKAAKRAAVFEECFAAVLVKLENMPDAEYTRLVVRLMEKYAEDGDEVIISGSDRDILTPQFFFEYNTGHNGKVVFNGSYDKGFRKGFVLSNSRCDKNLKFNELMENLKDNWVD